MKLIKSIWAEEKNSIIGHGLAMPGWHLTDDFLLNFVPKTKGNIVIMGRKTAESLGWRPLPGRINIVLSRNKDLNVPGFIFMDNFEEALAYAEEAQGDTIWIIGGGELYKLAMPYVSEIHITKVNGEFPTADPKEEIKAPNINRDIYLIDPSQTKNYFKRSPEGKDKGNTHDFTVEVYKRA